VTAATLERIVTNRSELYIQLSGASAGAVIPPKANRSFQLASVTLLGSDIDDKVMAAMEPPYAFLDLIGTRVTAEGLKSLKTDGSTIVVYMTGTSDSLPMPAGFHRSAIGRTFVGTTEVWFLPVAPAVLERVLSRTLNKASAEKTSP
jgi:hypothetical protein